MNDPSVNPHAWEQRPLSDDALFEFESGQWTGKKPPLVSIPVIRNTNLTADGDLDYSDVAVIQIEGRSLPRKLLTDGDIIIERSGGGPAQPVGRVGIYELPSAHFSFSNFTSRLRIRNSERVLARFLHLYLHYFHVSGQTETLQRRTTGIRNLDWAAYKAQSIPIPLLPEQTAIVKVLRTIQDAKETRRKEIELERERKAALMEYLFTHGTKGEKQKQTEIGLIPESWEVKRLGEVAALRGETVDPKISHDSIYVGLEHIDSGNPFLRRVGIANEVVSTKAKFSAGDLLYGKLRPYLDKVAIAAAQGICSTDILVIRPTTSNDEYFLVNVMHTRRFLDYAIAGTRGVNHPRTSWSTISEFQFGYPSQNERAIIAKLLQASDNRTELLCREQDLLDELFRAMLEELMSGRLSAVPLIDKESQA